MCPHSHPIDDARAQLQREGWSLGEVSFGERWVVEASRSGQMIQAAGLSQLLAWQAALRLAQSLAPALPPGSLSC